ncbi:MAG: choice-of-anchor L domain-containing protein [Nitrospirae bacterium]|nr:choice-of-anchor L domain-containing protein [Nitrospirota bacterium]
MKKTGIIVILFMICVMTGSASAIVTQDLNQPGITPTALAQALVGGAVFITDITYTGSNLSAGTFSGAWGDGLDIDSGIMLSSGDIANAQGPNTDDGISTNVGTPGDLDLDVIVAPDTTNDAAVLEFNFVPTATYFSFLYVFASDEYNEYVNKFNDVFGFYLNKVGDARQNIALVPLTAADAVSIDNINAGKNSEFYNNNDFGDFPIPPYPTQFDGFTTVLWAQGTVEVGQTYHMKLAIADTKDSILDSAVFLAAASFQSEKPNISSNKSALMFPWKKPGTSTLPKTVTLTSTGPGNVTIAKVFLSSTSPYSNTEFKIQNDTCSGKTINAGLTCTFDVISSPADYGINYGKIRVISNAFNKPLIEIPLQGSGESPVPIPDIKANGSNGPLTIFSAEGLSINIQLYPGKKRGLPADYWVLAKFPTGVFYQLDSDTLKWTQCVGATTWEGCTGRFWHGSLADIYPMDVFNSASLPPGKYIFKMRVDMNENGIQDAPIYTDTVTVNLL